MTQLPQEASMTRGNKRVQRIAALTWALCVACTAGCATEEVPDSTDGWFVWPDGGQTPASDTTEICSSKTCLGCCHGDTCLSGTSASSCGAGGAACVVCQAQEICSSGICVAEACDAISCPGGCCDADNTCQQGDTTSACGGGGGPCETCDADESCTEQVCTVKDPGLETYTVIATGAKITAAGTAFCNTLFNDLLCDVYLNVKSGGSESNTNTINNSISPQWNKTLFAIEGTQLKAGLTVKVYDDDPGPINQRICSVTYNVSDADLTSGHASFACSAAGVKMATLFFEFVAK
jgi:hypothetical protein